MKFFWGDYHKATRHLTRDQHGAYFLLIGEAWRLGGTLPDDDDMLSAWALCTAVEWAAMKPTIMAFFSSRRGKWTHDRVREELVSCGATSRKRKRAGKRGGTVSAENRRRNAPAIATVLPTKPEPKPESEPKIEASAVAITHAKSDDWPPGSTRDWQDALILVAGPGLGDPMKEMGLLTSMAEIGRWRTAGCSWENDVVPIIQARTLKPRQRPIGAWSVLTRDVLDAMARRLAPLEPSILVENPDDQRNPAPPSGLPVARNGYASGGGSGPVDFASIVARRRRGISH